MVSKAGRLGGAKGLLSASIAGGNAIIILGEATSNRLGVARGTRGDSQPGVSATTAYVPGVQFTIFIGGTSTRRL
jgi:hypothetical protein